MSKSIKVHDHTPNSYGLVIYTPGIDWSRFDSNPVMLDSHDDKLILGKWSDKTIKGNDVFMLPVFNEENDHAVSRKQEYDGGFLNGASIGIDFDWDDVQIRPDLGFSPEQPILVKCSCYEASLCAIPSNASALQLKSGGELLSPEQFKQKLTLKLSASTSTLSTKSHNMNLTLLKKQLSLDSATSDDAVIEMAMQRIADGEAAQKELGNLKLELQIKDEEQIELVVNEAKAQGKITDADVSDVKASLKLNFASGKKMLDLIPAKNAPKSTPVAEPVRKILILTKGTGAADDNGSVEISAESYDKLHKAGKLSLVKKNDPETFKALQDAKNAAVQARGIIDYSN